MKRLLVGSALALIIGCYPTHPPPFKVGPQQGRIQNAGAAWNRYSADEQEAIKQGKVHPGLDELAVYIAKGRPAFFWKTELQNGSCNVLLHGEAPDSATVNSATYTCGGIIAQVVPVEPELPCWRLAEVVPRIMDKRSYFEAQPLTHQWELVEGMLKRGQSNEDVNIAFGAPYNSGVEAREDGTNATTRVYLDSTGEAYGLYITFVNDKVTVWKIPPDRQLTPEAQKKRLEATEARLMAQLKQMEVNAEKRHKEQAALMTDLQARPEQILEKQVQGLALLAIDTGVKAIKKEVEHAIDKPTSETSRTLVLNECSFNDTTGDPEFGKPCGTGKGSCDGSYTCLVLIGKTGQCVPTSQMCLGPGPKLPPKKKKKK